MLLLLSFLSLSLALLVPDRNVHVHGGRASLLSGCRAPVLVDEAVVGGGPAGAHYVFRRTALSASGSSGSSGSSGGGASIALFDENPRFGGALRGLELRHPVTGQTNGTHAWRIGFGALRSGCALSYHEQRCLFAELGITVEMSPSHSAYFNRGASKTCRHPIWTGPDVPDSPYSAAPFQWGDNCSNDPIWIDNRTGRFVGIADGFESLVYFWLTGYETTHPKTGVKGLSGVDLACLPRNKHLDIRSFLAQELGTNEEAEFLKLFNFGFLGDFSTSVSACGWLSFQQREYDTSNVFGYPVGGMEELPIRMIARAQAQAASRGHTLQLYPRSRVEKIEQTSSSRFRLTGKDVLTGEQFVVDARRVILALGSQMIEKLQGSVAESLKRTAFVKGTKVERYFIAFHAI